MKFSTIVLTALLALIACARTDTPSTTSSVPASVMPTTPEPTPVELPPLPLISLIHNGLVYPGLRGSYSWPTIAIPGSVGFTQADAIRPAPSYAIPISTSDTLTVEIAANTPPSSIEVDIWISIPDDFVEQLVIDPGFTAPVTFDLPEGAYIVNVTAGWNNTIDSELRLPGGITYAFKIEVESSHAK